MICLGSRMIDQISLHVPRAATKALTNFNANHIDTDATFLGEPSSEQQATPGPAS
jgi:hypothetical protein